MTHDLRFSPATNYAIFLSVYFILSLLQYYFRLIVNLTQLSSTDVIWISWSILHGQPDRRGLVKRWFPYEPNLMFNHVNVQVGLDLFIFVIYLSSAELSSMFDSKGELN